MRDEMKLLLVIELTMFGADGPCRQRSETEGNCTSSECMGTDLGHALANVCPRPDVVAASALQYLIQNDAQGCLPPDEIQSALHQAAEAYLEWYRDHDKQLEAEFGGTDGDLLGSN